MATPRAFERGQRVKLAETYARALMLKRSMDWLHRRGTVRYCSPATVYIQWDGRATMDTVPVKGRRTRRTRDTSACRNRNVRSLS